MQDTEQNFQNEFMIEKMKERPVNKKKLLRRTIITASMAVIFGLIACFTFLVLEPVISNWLYPEEKPQLVVFPEDQEEMSPEEMLAENMEQEQQQLQQQQEQENAVQGPVSLDEEQIQEILSGVKFHFEHYKQMYNVLSDYALKLDQYMVDVSGITSNIDWFNNIQESENQASGVIIAENGKELLILVDYTPLEAAESLRLTFAGGIKANATLKEKDDYTNLAVLAVEMDDLDKEFLKKVRVVPLGSSNLLKIVGEPVVAVGSPMGTVGSLGYGIITSSTAISETDANYKVLQTDITGSKNAGGMLFNLQGQLVGIITNDQGSLDMKNMITAYGITELKKCVEKMANGEKRAYMGIYGVNVTDEAHTELNVPYGAYITEVEMDSPAMLAGIQLGDVLVAMQGEEITAYREYAKVIGDFAPGDTVELTIMRQVQEEYKEMVFEVVLKEKK